MIIKRPDGKEFRAMGYKAAAPRPGIQQYASSRLGQTRLPAKVDLRSYMTSIENQGNTNSCVANAVAGAYEYLVKRHLGEEAYDVSRLFIYYNARYLGQIEEDEGCIIQDAIEGLKQYGACSEETWSFEEEIVNEEPHEEAYDEAAQFVVESVKQVPLDLQAWKSALAEGNPIVFGIALYKSFDNHRKKGLVPMPSDTEAGRESHGGHAMLCVGYSDHDQVFIVRNSWGEDWGDQGYCYIPYDYLINPKFNDGDSWIIQRLDNFELAEETWEDDYDTIMQDLAEDLDQMSQEEYEEMIEAMGDYPVEFRIGLIMMYGAYTDGEFTDEEYEAIGGYLDDTIARVSTCDLDAQAILEACYEEMENEELVYESVDLLGEYLLPETLAKIVNDLQEIIGVDGLAEDEESFVYDLVEAWQIEEEEEETEGDYEEEDGDYSEDGEEYGYDEDEK
jgi:C1A family cysteine protease